MHKATAEYQKGFVSGNHDITLDLQGALHEKTSQYNWKDVPFLLFESKRHTQASMIEVSGKTMVDVDATQSEESEFFIV